MPPTFEKSMIDVKYIRREVVAVTRTDVKDLERVVVAVARTNIIKKNMRVKRA